MKLPLYRVLACWLGVGLLAATFIPATASDFAKRTETLVETVSEPQTPEDLPPAPLGPVIAFLELGESQVEVLLALIQQREQVVIPIAQEIAQLEHQLGQAVSAPNPQPPLIGVLTLQIRGRQAMIQQAQADFLEFFDHQLTAGQRAKLHAARTAKHLQPILPALGDIGLI